jgi:hypothetical protein
MKTYVEFQIENLMSMNRSLKQQKFDLEMLDQQRQAELNSARKEISNLESALFNAKAEVHHVHGHAEDFNLLISFSLTRLIDFTRKKSQEPRLKRLYCKYRKRSWSLES